MDLGCGMNYIVLRKKGQAWRFEKNVEKLSLCVITPKRLEWLFYITKQSK